MTNRPTNLDDHPGTNCRWVGQFDAGVCEWCLLGAEEAYDQQKVEQAKAES